LDESARFTYSFFTVVIRQMPISAVSTLAVYRKEVLGESELDACMKPCWLNLLLIFALMLPVTTPRLTSAMIAGSTPLQGSTQNNTTQTEEEEVHERTATSRQTQRIARGSCPTVERYSLSRRGRIHTASPGIPPLALTVHNGFGGNITC